MGPLGINIIAVHALLKVIWGNITRWRGQIRDRVKLLALWVSTLFLFIVDLGESSQDEVVVLALAEDVDCKTTKIPSSRVKSRARD